MQWSLVDSNSLGEGTWGHSAFSVVAIPHWKIFLFGGQRGSLVRGSTPLPPGFADSRTREGSDQHPIHPVKE